MQQGSLPSWERLTSILRFNPQSGTVLWISPPKYHPDLLGKEAGTRQRNGGGKIYWAIKVDGNKYKRGRLMFFFVNKRWPIPCIDHKNGNSLDDRIDNLREATVTQNSWNHKKRDKQSVLPMGVRVAGSGRFQARIAYNNKMLHLGTYATPEEASSVYQTKRSDLYGVFA